MDKYKGKLPPFLSEEGERELEEMIQEKRIKEKFTKKEYEQRLLRLSRILIGGENYR